MGEIIRRKIKGMNWKAKISLVLIFTLVFSTFLHQGLYKPKGAESAITYVSAGTIAYSAAGGATVAPAYPASIAANNLLVLIVGMKPSTANSGSVTTPAGWTPIVSLTGAGGYGATLGADTGNTNLFTFYKVAAGTETGNLTVDLTTNNISWAQIYRLTKTAVTWNVAGATGSDTTAGNVSIAFGSDPGVTAGDYILGAMCIPTDVTTPAQFTAEAFTQTGVTFGAVTEISEPDSAAGNQIGGFVIRADVTAGTGSAAPTMTATAGGTTTNVRGPGVFIRIREAAALPSTITTCAGCHQYSPTFTDSGTRNGTTGQFPGSHSPHVQAKGYACDVCHVVPATTTSADFKHRTGTIQFRDPINGNTNARYSKASGTPYSFAQTNTAFTGGTCSVTACHGTVSTAWGTNTTNRDCTKCHGNPYPAASTWDSTTQYKSGPGADGPVSGTGGGVDTANQTGTYSSNVSNDVQVGAHKAHLQAPNQYSNPIACSQCHSSVNFTDIVFTNHMNGSVALQWGALATHNSGSYAGGQNLSPAYTVGSGGNCTSTYCHGGGTYPSDNGTKAVPAWTNGTLLAGTGGADCGKCHGNPPATSAHTGQSANVCNACHPHVINSKTTAPFFQTSGAFSLASHINGVTDVTGDCLGCHNTTKTKTKGTPGTLRNIVGAGGDFTRASRHLITSSLAQITKWDCVICHKEGQHTGSPGDPDPTYHQEGSGVTGGRVNLRDVDNPAAAGWAINNRTWTTTDYTNLDLFCLACHDSDGANSITVNATNNGLVTTAGAARRLTPFNTTNYPGGVVGASTTFGTFTRNAVIDIKTKFTTNNPSQHGVIGARYTTNNAGWVAGAWTNYASKKSGNVMNVTRERSVISCADCHVLDSGGGANGNAHGGANAYNLNSSNIGTHCQTCHNSNVYPGGATGSRFNHASYSRATGSYEAYGIASTNNCLMCHAGWDGSSVTAARASYGGIHGGSGTYPPSGLTKYRFQAGTVRSQGFSTNNNDTSFGNTNSQTCYFVSTADQWSNCNKHSGGPTGTFTANYSRPVTY